MQLNQYHPLRRRVGQKAMLLKNCLFYPVNYLLVPFGNRRLFTCLSMLKTVSQQVYVV